MRRETMRKAFGGHLMTGALVLAPCLGLLASPPSADAQLTDPSPLPPIQLPTNILVAQGTSFAISPGSDTAVTLETSQPIDLTLESFPGLIHMGVKSMSVDSSSSSVRFTLSNLHPNATYYQHQDGFIASDLVTDAQGVVSYDQEISSTTRIVTLNLHKSTIYITPTGVSPPTPAIVAYSGSYYVQTQDIFQSIIIQAGGVVFSGGGHKIVGSGTGVGITVSGVNDVSLSQVDVSGFQEGVFFGNSSNLYGTALSGSKISSNSGPGVDIFSSSHIVIFSSTLQNNGSQLSSPAQVLITNSNSAWLQYDTFGPSSANQAIGVLLSDSNSATIRDNTFSGLIYGVYVTNQYVAGSHLVTNNTLNGVAQGVVMFGSSKNQITSNHISSAYFGVYAANMGGNTIQGNTIQDSETAIAVSPGDVGFVGGTEIIQGNTITALAGVVGHCQPFGCGVGIQVENTPASQEIVSQNTITGPPLAGIYLLSASGNRFTNNTIIGGTYGTNAGILLSYAYAPARDNGNTFIGNTIKGNSVGMTFDSSSGGNVIYHNNFLGNGVPAATGGSANTWSEPYPIGGNNGAPFAGAIDARYGDKQDLPVKDGVSDVPFVLDANNEDGFPFMNQNGWLVDTIPPGPISLTATSNGTSASLSWNAPGDDWYGPDQGPAVYDIRVAPAALSQATFESALSTERIMPPTVHKSGSGETPSISLPYPTNYIAIKSTDAAGNTSSISNQLVISGTAVSYLSQSPESSPIASILSMTPGVQLNFASSTDQNAIFQLANNFGNAPIGNVYLCSGNTSPLTFPSPGATVTFSYASFGITDPTALRILKTDANNMIALPAPTIDSVHQTVSDSIGSCSFFVLATIPTDSLPPRTALNIGLPNHGAAPVAINTFTPLSFTSTDDFRVVGDSVGVGVAATYYAVDAATFTLFASSFTIPVEGLHSIRFYSVDNAGHQEAVNTSTVAVDHTPPVTQFSASSPVFYAVDGSKYVGPASSIGLSATDPLSAGVAAGPQATDYAVDNAALALYASTFSLTEGAHTLSFQSTDWVGNVEILKSATLKADVTPPLTQLVIQGTQTVNGAVLYVNYGAAFGFAAQDPISHGVASGVKQTLYSVDGGAFGPFQTAFALAAGTHTLAFQSVDNVGNLETPRVSSFTLLPNDVLPPRTTLIVGQPQYGTPRFS